MAEEVTKAKEDQTLQDKLLKLQSLMEEPIIVTLSVSELSEIRLEMAMPRRRWSEEDPDDGVDEDGPCEINSPDFNMLKSEVNYFG
ncbi:MAG TPA: hypothetical protein DF712_20955 [Balneola sp.]|nr:hypothetical protein [Balneola sp.]|tara:strand:+ start:179 stop:436 length:258 start_codon:yes stop_codon:yes gene_type:complete